MQRQLLVGAVGLVKFRMRDLGPSIRRVCDSIEPILEDSNFLSGAPFEVLSIILRIDNTDVNIVEIEKINKKHRELPVNIHVAAESLKPLRERDLDAAVRDAVLFCILKVADFYRIDATSFLSRWEKEFGEK